MLKILKNKKGFTLIELIVTIAVLSVLVLLASPRFFGHTQNAELTKGFANARTIEKASELYYMDNNDWPRLTDEPYTSEEIESYSERIFDRTGQEVNLDPEGNYYDIDYDKLSDYVQVSDDKKNYILQNPVGKVFYMENLNETGQARVNYDNKGEPEEPKEEALYEFKSATFTNAGATGRFGPTQEQLDNEYVGTDLEGQIISENGIQLWTVPKSGTYRIEAYGAQGGNNSEYVSGLGAIMKGDFKLKRSQSIKILVAQKGKGTNYPEGFSGGGGSFIVENQSPLIVAGGGGSHYIDSPYNRNLLNANVGEQGNYTSGSIVGEIGYGGKTGSTDGPGGGMYSDGEGPGGGIGFINGGFGAFTDIHGGTEGGFGGGGARTGSNGEGSGGGYSGGNGHLERGTWQGGTGGGSFNSGANQENSVGNTGYGKVIITYIGE